MKKTVQERLKEALKILEHIDRAVNTDEPLPENVNPEFRDSYRVGRVQGHLWGWQSLK